MKEKTKKEKSKTSPTPKLQCLGKRQRLPSSLSEWLRRGRDKEIS